MSFHDHDKRFESAKKKTLDSSISEKNKQLILELVDDLVLENLSQVRLSKYFLVLRRFAEKTGKDFDKITEPELKRYIGDITQRTDYSVWTKKAYKVIIRRFYRWMEKTKNYPNIVSWINVTLKRCDKTLPSEGDLLTENEALKLIDLADHPRDKALLSMLWKSGARIGEIGTLRLKDVVFDEHGILICVKGKTGSRKIRLITSIPYVSTWINNHPLRNNKESPLWVNIGSRENKKMMHYRNVRVLIQNLANRAGIDKRCNPHLFRHSRATVMANYLTEFQMNQYFGWIQGSDMPSTYVHMSGKEVDNAVLAMNGIKIEESRESRIKPKICPRCDTINGINMSNCNKCGGILDITKAIMMDREKTQSENIMARLLQDQDVQELLMAKLRSF